MGEAGRDLRKMPSGSGAAFIMRALVDVFIEFQETMAWLRTHDGVVSVDRSCWMTPVARTGDHSFAVGRGEGFEIAWYAEANFDIGADISYAMSLIWDTSDWIVQSSVRGYRNQEEEVLDERSQTMQSEEVALEVIRRVSSQLYADRQDSLRKFLDHYGTANRNNANR